MTILIHCPPGHDSARDYILQVIFTEFLGLPWRRIATAGNRVRLSVGGAAGEIGLPDVFFAHPAEAWLTASTLPSLPLATWDSRELAPDIILTDPIVPVV